MKNITLFLIFCLLISCDYQNDDADLQEIKSEKSNNTENNIYTPLLWNYNDISKKGITYKSWFYQGIREENRNFSICDLNSNSESHYLHDNYSNFSLKCLNQENIYYENKIYPGLRFVALNFKNKQFRQYPGFDIWTIDETPNSVDQPIEFAFISNARNDVDTHFPNESYNKVREVGMVFENYPYSTGLSTERKGLQSFRRNFLISEFDIIQLNLKSRISSYTSLSTTNNAEYNAHLVADLRLNSYNEEKQLIGQDVISVVLSNIVDIQDKHGIVGDALIERHSNYIPLDEEGRVKPNSLRKVKKFLGNKLGINTIKNLSSDNYTNIELDYKSIIKKYIDYDNELVNQKIDTIISGLDIYSYNLKTDIAYWIKDVKLYGVTTSN